MQGEQKKEFQSRKSGTIGPYTFQATIYNMSSQYGVREGNILKLELRLAETNELVAYFDHEWSILPDDENIHCVIDSLVYHYEASEVEKDVKMITKDNTMTESRTALTDKFFRVTRKLTHYVLGSDHKGIFEFFTKLEWNVDDDLRLIDASGMKVKPDWFIGTLHEPVVIHGHCYPTGSLAVFQSKELGSHFVIFSFEEGDETM